MRQRELTYRPWLARYSLIALVATVLLLYAGGFTTTIGAGMVFPDWPLSNGSINPEGWTENTAMAAEHGHRLLGMIVGNLTLILAIWIWRVEPRRWMRLTALAALILVVIQGLLGGIRVLENEVNYAIVHGCLAQVFLCVLAAIAVGQTKAWQRLRDDPAKVQMIPNTTGLVLIGLVFVQLIVAAIMRHKGAGLAIPTFPLTPEGTLIPAEWSFPVTIHFAHRVLALLITVLYAYWALELLRNTSSNIVRAMAYASCALVLIQVALGAGVIWMGRTPLVTTLHVLNGAFLLATTWATHFFSYAPALEPHTRSTESHRSGESSNPTPQAVSF